MARSYRAHQLTRGRVFGLERRSQAQGFRARRSVATYGLLRGFIRPSEACLGVYVRVNRLNGETEPPNTPKTPKVSFGVLGVFGGLVLLPRAGVYAWPRAAVSAGQPLSKA